MGVKIREVIRLAPQWGRGGVMLSKMSCDWFVLDNGEVTDRLQIGGDWNFDRMQILSLKTMQTGWPVIRRNYCRLFIQFTRVRYVGLFRTASLKGMTRITVQVLREYICSIRWPKGWIVHAVKWDIYSLLLLFIFLLERRGWGEGKRGSQGGRGSLWLQPCENVICSHQLRDDGPDTVKYGFPTV